SGELVWSVEAMRLAPTRIEFAAGGRRFTVTREDGTLHEWDAGSGGLLAVRAATTHAPSLELETILPGQIIRERESGDEIGYYVPGKYGPPGPVIHVERLAALGRWLLTHQDDRLSVLDEKPLRGQWLFSAECVWSASVAHLTATAISPGGRFVLAGRSDGPVELWKVGEA